MPALANPRHERFAQELAKGKSATEALIRAEPAWCARVAEESARVAAENAKLSRFLRRIAQERAPKAE